MKTKLVNFKNIICRLDYIKNIDFPTQGGNVVMLLINPPCTVETEQGLSHAPAESIEVYGIDDLLKLSDELRDFCEHWKSNENDK